MIENNRRNPERDEQNNGKEPEEALSNADFWYRCSEDSVLPYSG
ncbi:hypothetical protein [Corynebacterium macginleyi]|nr:hypothetical protein [Corynebacterium macginleyi]